MSDYSEPEGISHHNRDELDNYQSTDEILTEWLNSRWPSGFVIKETHSRLLSGIDSYGKKGLIRSEPGVYRKVDLRVGDEPENFYVRGTDIDPTMRNYCDDLDIVLESLPENAKGNMEQIIHNAAWAYYTYIRIHPFFDGNGRSGRVILNRIIMGSGLEELIFMDTWFDKERDTHLEAMNLVDKIGNLAPLELYLAHTLRNYKSNEPLYPEIDAFIGQKEKEILDSNFQENSLDNIWDGFAGLDLYGVKDNYLDEVKDLEPAEETKEPELVGV